MSQRDLLREKRKDLVLAAKSVMEAAFRGNAKVLKKAQLSHLIGVCNEAACAEEIELYIRYQASRDRGEAVWGKELANSVIAKAQTVIEGLPSDEVKVSAWRLYAVYLTREFTYQNEAHAAKPVDHRRGPAPDRSRDDREKGGRG